MKKNNPDSKTISAETAHALLKDLSGSATSFSGKIQGSSMLPWIKDADTITIYPLATPIKVGEIVVFYDKANSRFIAHRVIQLTKKRITTKGDNCLSPDPALSIDKIAGRVTSIQRGIEQIHFGLGSEAFFIAILSRANILQWIYRVIKKLKPMIS